MRTPKVSIIIVNYNGKKFLRPCLKSVFNLDYPKTKLEVIVVDNGSTDKSISMVKKDFPKVKILKNDENNYCKANNLGIKNSKGEYIGFVNNDVRLDKNWIKELVESLVEHSAIAGAMGKILFKKGLIQSTGHYELPNFYWGDRGFREKDEGQFDRIEQLKTLPNIASLYRRKIFDKIGLFDEDFGMYLEDVDLGIRCQKQNLKFLYIPTAICYHKFHGTAKEEFLQFKIEKNRLFLIAKHYPDKLPDSLFGKGYFQGVNIKGENTDILNILPEILKKLFKNNNYKNIDFILPKVFNEVSKFINNDRYYLTQMLRDLEDKYKEDIALKNEEIKEISRDREEQINEIQERLNDLNETIKNKDEEISKKNEELLEKKDEILHQYKLLNNREIELAQKQNLINAQKEDINQKLKIINRHEKDIEQKRELISKLERERVRLDNIIHEKDEKLQYFYKKNKEFYNSQTYRFILRPLWFFIDIPKRIFKIGRFGYKKIVIIKPKVVNIEDTKKGIDKIKSKHKSSRIILISLLENTSNKPYIKSFKTSKNIIFYQGQTLFNITKSIELFFRLVLKGSHLTYILIGPIINKGYRKAKKIALLTRTRAIKLYLLNQDKEEDYPCLTKLLFLNTFKSITLYLLIALVVLITGKMKLTHIFNRILPQKSTNNVK